MELRERPQHDHQDGMTAPAGGGAAIPDLDPARDEARSFLDAGRAAIARALSRDSEQFLRAGRQQGGQ